MSPLFSPTPLPLCPVLVEKAEVAGAVKAFLQSLSLSRRPTGPQTPRGRKRLPQFLRKSLPLMKLLLLVLLLASLSLSRRPTGPQTLPLLAMLTQLLLRKSPQWMRILPEWKTRWLPQLLCPLAILR